MIRKLLGKIRDFCEFGSSGAHPLTPGGKFHLEHWRGSACLDRQEVKNGIASEGLHFVLDQAFRNQAGATAWYLGLVDLASFSSFANADTMALHAGWIEVTAYTEGTRQLWDTIAAAARAITNTTVATFTINATKTVHGFFVTSSSVKGGTAGKLWATGPLSVDRAVVSGDLIKLTYTVTGPA